MALISIASLRVAEPDAGGGTSQRPPGWVYGRTGEPALGGHGSDNAGPSGGHIGRISTPSLAAPPTSTDLAVGQRRLENRLDVMRSEFEAHQAEAHPRPLPNVVGSLQAQWQVMPAPIKQVIQVYGAMFLVAATVRFLLWFLATFRRHQVDTESQPHISIVRQWPPT